MAIADKNNSLLLSDTLVPDLFIYHYMMSLSKEAISLYMYINANSKCSFTESDLEEISLMDKNTTKEAVSELIAATLLSKDSSGSFTLVDIKKIEVDSYCAATIAKGGANLSDLELSPLQAERESLCDSISKSIYSGKMGFIFYRIVDKCLFEYGFETFVIYSLFDMAKEKKFQYNAKEVEKMADKWFKDGIKDSESLNRVLETEAKISDLIKVVGSITRKRVDGFDIERITKWVSLGINKELIEFAFRSNSYRDSLRTKDVDDTLSRWIEAGITTIEAASKFEDEQHKENKRKYTRRKNTDSNYRTGKDAGLTVSEVPKATAQISKPQTGDSSVNDILNLFGDMDNEDN